MAMVRSGGESEKLGFVYEARWRMILLLRVISEEAESVMYEGFDKEFSEGVDAELRFHSRGRFHSEFHSVKRQTAVHSWSPKSIGSGPDSVLGQLVSKLGNSSRDRGLFLSSSPVELLPQLADAIRRSPDAEAFRARLANASIDDRNELEPLYFQFQEWMGMEEERTFAVLRSLDFRQRSEQELEEQLVRTIRREIIRVDGGDLDEAAVAHHLHDLMEKSLGTRINRAHILEHLEKLEIPCCASNLRHNPSAVVAMAKQVGRFIAESEQSLIGGRPLPRAEATDILDLLDRSSRKWIVVTGDGGGGKSCILAQVARGLDELGIPVFPLRFDTASPIDSIARLKEYLNLGWDPVVLLDDLAERGRSVLVVDQVDALSTVAGRRNIRQWDVLHELISDARACPNMSIVIACREFDLRNDPRLRELLAHAESESRGGGQPEGIEIKVGLLDVEVVKSCLESRGINHGTWTGPELDVLRVPLHLALFLQCEAVEVTPVESLTALYRRYFRYLARQADSDATDRWDFNACLKAAVTCFSDDQAVAVEYEKIMAAPGPVSFVERLISCGVLRIHGEGNRKMIRFFHDTMFDHAFAQTFIDEERSLMGLLSADFERQDLFRRTQCRQVLTFLRAGNQVQREKGLADLRGLITSDLIRIHIKFFLLMWLNSLPDPTTGEFDLIRLAALSPPSSRRSAAGRKKWRDDVFRLGTWNRVAWFRLLLKNGQWGEWLRRKDQGWAADITRMLGSRDIMSECCDDVLNMVERELAQDPALCKLRTAQILCWAQYHLSEKASRLFARAFVENWPGLDDRGIWQHQLNRIAGSSKSSAVMVMECIILRRLRIARSGKLIYEVKPPGFRQRIREILDLRTKTRLWNPAPTKWQRVADRVKRHCAGFPWLKKMESGFTGDFSRLKARIINALFPHGPRGGLRDHDLAEFLKSCARHFPSDLANCVLDLLENLKKTQPDRIGLAFSWLWHGFSHLDDEACGALDTAFRTSLGKVAADDPGQAAGMVARLQALAIPEGDLLTMEAWTANPEHFAPQIVPFLRSNPQRLFRSSSTHAAGNDDLSGTRALLNLAKDHLSYDEVREIETLVIRTVEERFELGSFTKEFESRHNRPADKSNANDRRVLLKILRWRNFARYKLLSILPADKLSGEGRKNLAAWAAEFEPQVKVRSVGEDWNGGRASLIDREVTSKMDLGDFKNALNRYPADSKPHSEASITRETLLENISYLASVDRQRFHGWLAAVEGDENDDLRTAVLSGLFAENEKPSSYAASTSLSDDEIAALVRPFVYRPAASLSLAACRALARRRSDYPPSWVDLLLQFALIHSDPEPLGEDLEEPAAGKIDLLFQGKETVRGFARYQLAIILFDHREFSSVIRPRMPELLKDSSSKVKATVLELLVAWINISKSEAVDWFVQITSDCEELLASSFAERFLAYACTSHHGKLGKVVETMVRSECKEMRMAGMRQTIRCAFADPSWERPANRLATRGSSEVRSEAIAIAARHWALESCRPLAGRWLSTAFRARDQKIQNAAAAVFGALGESFPKDMEDLAYDFLASPAFLGSVGQLMRKLGKANPLPVDLVIGLSAKIIDAMNKRRKMLGTIRELRWGSPNLSGCLLMAYNMGDRNQRSSCLDLLDAMLADGFYGIDELVKDTATESDTGET